MEENPHHKVSRRSFLKSGFVSGVLLTNPFGMLGNLFPKSAFAIDATSVPFCVFDLEGGAALPGHFMPLTSNYEYLTNYNSVRGRSVNDSGAVDRQFGTPMFVGADYEIHKALLAICSKGALEKLRFITVCHQSISDKPFNLLSAVQLVTRVSKSKLFKTGLGTYDTLSGGHSNAYGAVEGGKPLLITDVKDIIRHVKPTGPLASLTDTEVSNLGNLGADLASIQAKTLFGRANPRAESVVNAYQSNAKNLNEKPKVDPSESADVRAVFQNNSSSVAAGIAFNVLNGNASAGVFRFDGFDYHTPKTREEVKAKDKEFGEALARTIQLAHVMRKPMVAQIITDGGCAAGTKDTYWAIDDNSKSMTVLAFYHPDGPREQEKHFQLGNYFYNLSTDSIGADPSTYMGKFPENAALISYANYLAFSGGNKLENGLSLLEDKIASEIKKHVLFKI